MFPKMFHEVSLASYPIQNHLLTSHELPSRTILTCLCLSNLSNTAAAVSPLQSFAKYNYDFQVFPLNGVKRGSLNFCDYTSSR